MTFFSSFIICAVFACCYVSADKILSIPLKLKDSPLTAMLKQSVHPSVITAILKAEAQGHFPLPLKYNYMRNEYFTEIHLGQPGQKFIVSFDTTWVDSWVPSSSCSFSSVQCMIRNQYNENKSRTSIKTPYNFHVTLGNSDLAGNIFNDLLNINGVNVTSQSFAAVSEIPWLFVYSSFDGIFGMGLDHYDKIVPVMWNLKKQKIIDQLVFSFHFKGDEGSMVLGGVDPAHYEGNFTYFNVVNSDPPQWMVRVDDMTLTRSKNETIKVCKSGCNAVMSTGGSQIYGPSKDIAAINSFIKAKDLPIGGLYYVSCSEVPKLPNITISLGNTPFVLEGHDYIQKVKMTWFKHMCISAFTSNYDDNDDSWYVGGAFMSRYYTTFDMLNGKIGFATAK